MHITLSIAAAVDEALKRPAQGRGLAVATLVAWTLTASLGAYMLIRWIASGGLRRSVTSDPLVRAVVFGHFSLAITGLMMWIGYVATDWNALAWLGIGLLMPAIGLGISTVTIWTPFPGDDVDTPIGGMVAGPAENVLARKITDEQLTEALTDDVVARRLVEDVLASMPANAGGAEQPHGEDGRRSPAAGSRKQRGNVALFVPFGHGAGALATFALAVVTAVVSG